MPELTARFQIGVVAGTHGLKGEVKVFPTTDDVKRFQQLKTCYLVSGRDGERTLTLERARGGGKFVILKFKDLDRIEDVERFRSAKLFVDRKDAIPLEEGEYYVADLIGLTVVNEDGETVGTLTDVIFTGANDVYACERADGKGEVLLPAIKDCVKSVDMERRVMTVHVMEGLM